MQRVLSSKPIGIFDSGVGGLTVANAVCKAFPNEQIVYFGDTAHLPYGDKSADAIRYYSIKISKFLLEQECKMIVIACNSASSAAYEVLIDFFKEKCTFINVVDPLVKEVVHREYQKVGVIATKATVRSNIYKHKIESYNQNIKVHQLATPLLVPMIEEGFYNDEISDSVLNKYLGHHDLKGIDALLLACTHYPLIKKEIKNFFNNEVDVLDSTDVVVDEIKNYLSSNDLENMGTKKENLFYVSDFTKSFEETTKLFFDDLVQLKVEEIW